MALLESKPTQAFELSPFQLPDVYGQQHSSSAYQDAKVLVVTFLCGHCPYVKAVEERIIKLAKQCQEQSVQFLGICSNDPTDHPEDSPEALRQRVEQLGYPFPYLIDADQAVARQFGAVCTPEFYAFDAARQLRYHGRLDDNWQAPNQVQQEDLKGAIQALLKDQPIPEPQIPSMGCSIKWKQGA
jgi:peroxiredoxin